MKLHVAQWLEMAKSDARSAIFVTPQEWGNSEQSHAEIVQELQDELALAENGVDAARKHLSEKTATDIAEYAGIAVSVTYTHPIQIRQAKVTANYSGKNFREFVELSRKALCELRAEKYGARLARLRAMKKYVYRMDVLERSLSYDEVTEIFVRVNSLGAKLRSSDLALAQITAKWRGALVTFQTFQAECTI